MFCNQNAGKLLWVWLCVCVCSWLRRKRYLGAPKQSVSLIQLGLNVTHNRVWAALENTANYKQQKGEKITLVFLENNCSLCCDKGGGQKTKELSS